MSKSKEWYQKLRAKANKKVSKVAPLKLKLTSPAGCLGSLDECDTLKKLDCDSVGRCEGETITKLRRYFENGR